MASLSLKNDIYDFQIFNKYWSNIEFLGISLHNKHYRVAMFKFLNLLLVNWQLWNKVYNYELRFIIITEPFLLLRFYNNYYFKIHNY